MSILYYNPVSPPSRGTLLTVRNLALDIELKPVDILGGETRSAEFKKINPLGKVPVLQEDDFILSDSHAISQYLVRSQAPGSTLYPTDFKIRATVDSRLFYNSTMIFPKISVLIWASIQKQPIMQTDKDEITNILNILNEYLEQTKFIAANHLTIADFSILANVATIIHMGFDVSGLKKLGAWYKSLESIPGYEENETGAKTLAGYYEK